MEDNLIKSINYFAKKIYDLGESTFKANLCFIPNTNNLKDEFYVYSDTIINFFEVTHYDIYWKGSSRDEVILNLYKGKNFGYCRTEHITFISSIEVNLNTNGVKVISYINSK